MRDENKPHDPELDFDIEINPSDCDLGQSYCPTCGSAHDPTDVLCKHCGCSFLETNSSAQNGTQSKEDYTQNNADVSSPQFSADANGEEKYIAQNIYYYQEKFSEIRAAHKKTSWNWAAFLFAPYWCIYRKMYGIGTGVFAAVFILSLLGSIGYILLLIGYVLFGVFANYIYLQYIELQKDLGSLMPDPIQSQHIREKGGTNIDAAILSAIGFGILVVIITFSLGGWLK